MAVSFNGCSITITPAGGAANVYGLRSLTFGGGNINPIDVTAANSGRRLQIPGLREPLTITVEAIAPTTATQQLASGSLCDWTIGGNATMTTSGTAWYIETVETSGSIDEVNVISFTLVEGSGAA